MSNEIKMCLFFSLMLPNHSITFCVFLHWFTLNIDRRCVFSLSKIDLLIFPELIAFGWVDESAFWVICEIFLMIFKRNESFAFFHHRNESCALKNAKLSFLLKIRRKISKITQNADSSTQPKAIPEKLVNQF